MSYKVIPFLPRERVQRAVRNLGRAITEEFADSEKIVAVGVLRGCVIFLADLVRQINLPVEIDFVEVSSYGNSMESSREVKIHKDISGEIRGRDVILVEDIIDTGHTMVFIRKLLESHNPRKLKVVTLLDKPSRREVEVNADFTGFEVPDEWVVGYGFDYAQRNRNLPFIGKVSFDG